MRERKGERGRVYVCSFLISNFEKNFIKKVYPLSNLNVFLLRYVFLNSQFIFYWKLKIKFKPHFKYSLKEVFFSIFLGFFLSFVLIVFVFYLFLFLVQWILPKSSQLALRKPLKSLEHVLSLAISMAW